MNRPHHRRRPARATRARAAGRSHHVAGYHRVMDDARAATSPRSPSRPAPAAADGSTPRCSPAPTWSGRATRPARATGSAIQYGFLPLLPAARHELVGHRRARPLRHPTRRRSGSGSSSPWPECSASARTCWPGHPSSAAPRPISCRSTRTCDRSSTTARSAGPGDPRTGLHTVQYAGDDRHGGRIVVLVWDGRLRRDARAESGACSRCPSGRSSTAWSDGTVVRGEHARPPGARRALDRRRPTPTSRARPRPRRREPA